MRAFIGLILIFSLSGKLAAEPLKIAVASNFKPTLEALEKLWAQQHETDWVISSGPSGALTQQIIHGAPFAVFLSADESFADKIHSLGLGAKPVTYARGQLILACKHSAANAAQALAQARRLALANTRTAPYGMAAQQWLTQYGGQLSAQRLQAGSVAGALQHVVTGNTDCALVAASFATLAPQLNWYPLPNAITLKQALVQLQTTAQAESFVAFMQSPAAQQLILEHGYLKAE
ncbi:molybdate ABC transporter substrate-binding protein [Gilvimarinus sp. DA14]|uniref:molybdate ABC transporter substrate-binding protein n=1 Tax=Gilvimarinus sp. DA14 TaxID=2956798 RepID=UPI0020B8EB17|nr:molybdate ABC transporter substrate-binding protein [Gilvimarinus sp. DA14]UTF59337.1 molybdate ABC transporter substrate-binding protein [Gilvimarinus sp. DA14]